MDLARDRIDGVATAVIVSQVDEAATAAMITSSAGRTSIKFPSYMVHPKLVTDQFT